MIPYTCLWMHGIMRDFPCCALLCFTLNCYHVTHALPLVQAVGLGVGVAKEAEVVAVRILDCEGSGSISDTVAG